MESSLDSKTLLFSTFLLETKTADGWLESRTGLPSAAPHPSFLMTEFTSITLLSSSWKSSI